MNFKDYILLARWDKPVGSWLLFFPCLWGLGVSLWGQEVTFQHILYGVYFLLGAFLMRGAGCVWNDILDRDMDKAVERTKGRPLAAGRVTVRGAVVFMGLQCLLALVILLQFPRQAVIITLCSLVLVAVYPLMKRVTHLPQLWLGLTFNWGVWVGGFTGGGDLLLLGLVYCAGIFWTLGYDTIYAMQDKEDDVIAGVRSTAILFGERVVYWVGGFYVVCHGVFFMVGYLGGVGLFYWIFWLLGGVHLWWQVRGMRGGDYGRLFRSNSYYGLLMAGGFACTI